ncbi:hypothetical protein H0H81_007611 [Sphagnurus paluster]|uniref:GYF domain-containing protein n=1 Tax=Sphagnurus paluster TaxID=117069 RepID=A0A9P7FT34_9AGAR|nr:hypothetical protein H0H81_007611 [Sphagnurus paluster]
MHFGPEWMRTKHQMPARAQPPPSPPPNGASTYSALVSLPAPSQNDKRDEAHPFRYSKEELLRIYKEGGGKGGLGLEVERWEGVVREVGSEPVALREMGDAEKKLFQGPLNSDLRRRQSTDYLSPLSTQTLGNERSRLSANSPASATASPLRDRFGALRRRDSADQPTLTIPRKQSFSNSGLQPGSPRDIAPSPRRGPGYTPGFDGILSGGDSWVARRRASEASLKATSGTPREGGGDYQPDVKASEIREEEEETNREADIHSRSTGDPDRKLSPQTGGTELSLPDRHPTAQLAPSSEGLNDRVGASVPNSAPDLTTVQWSYKDPSGQIQGPFNAELMQKWFDEGYFTGDLPMKRTHLDLHWVTVDDLVKGHGGSTKIFVTPPPPILPPGLAHRASQNFTPDPLIFNGPYQPAPVRNLRSSTLDSFGSPSDSPSSSFGAGRFGNGSPDPNAFGGRAAYFGDNTIGGRQPFATIPDPAQAFNRRPFNNEPLDPSLAMRPAFGNVISGRGPIVDGFGYNRTYSPGQGWNTGPFETSNGNRGSVDSFSSPFGPTAVNNFGTSQDVFGDSSSFQNPDFSHFNGAAQPNHYSPSPTTQYQQAPGAYGLQGTALQGTSSELNHSPVPSHSPWNSESPAPRRPGPFDAAHPTASNTIVIQPVVETSPWAQGSQPSRPSSQNDSSPWTPSSQGLGEDNWKVAPGPDSLTFSNVGQHNQQQQQLANPNTEPTINKAESSEPSVIIPIADSVPPVEPMTKPIPPTKSKSKAVVLPKPIPKTTPVAPQAPPEPSPPPAPKVAWSKEEEGKAKPPGVSVSLREIQEAEAKKAEARKAAEREKERAARATVSTPDTKEGPQPFTASWGLPTSQAGVRSSAPVKESTATSNPAAAPVWTNVPKPAVTKKTMKEIQEEEEKRKKTATKESVASATRRAYADTTQKVNSAPPTSQGSAWTTVGPSGKPNSTTAPVRPAAVTPSTSSLSVPSTSAARTNGATVSRPVSVSPVVKTAPITARNDDPPSPSHEFLKWLTASLKGLNSSVNVEEIVALLLSFSLDPDPSTVDFISETIYANSTTLDGRRFAAEFVNKRKADANSRPKGANATSKAAAKPISIADVVKAAPKPTQPEWGFKVVNKKKKSGRA